MKKILFLFLISTSVLAQNTTEIYVFDLEKTKNGFTIKNQKNISNNPGYDSQPHFYDNQTVLFASTRNNQTDILKMDLISGKKTFINSTIGGEYSPQRIPKSKHISAIRLDTTGYQRFYKYNSKTGESEELINDLKVAYPFWYDKSTVVSSVIVKDKLELFVNDVKKKTNKGLGVSAGRSFHKIPNTNLISYINKDKRPWSVYSLNPKTLEQQKIAKIDGRFEDMCWLPNGTILLAKNHELFQLNPKTDTNWSLFYSFPKEQMGTISRITISSDGKKLALVAEDSPVIAVKKQLAGYNNRDIDAYLEAFSKDVKVYRYPNKLQYQGKEEMRKRYASFFENTKDLHCKIVKRIVNGNIVIDEESLIMNGKKRSTVAIYEVTNGLITSVTFL